MCGLPIEYRRYAMEKTGVIVDKPRNFVFERLKEAIELRIVAVEGVE